MFISSIVSGIIITLITGLIVNTPPMLVGATHYGYPFAWLTRLILASQYFPWRISALYLIVDVAFWAIIAGIILYVSSLRSRR